MKDALQQYLENAIPLVRAMQVGVTEAGDDRVVLEAPLAPNLNHKFTAFGGSVASLATLACWGWLWARLRGHGVSPQIVIARSEIDYLLPLTTRLVAVCPAPPRGDWDAFVRAFERRGRGRLNLDAVVEDVRGGVCARFSGRFAATRDLADA